MTQPTFQPKEICQSGEIPHPREICIPSEDKEKNEFKLVKFETETYNQTGVIFSSTMPDQVYELKSPHEKVGMLYKWDSGECVYFCDDVYTFKITGEIVSGQIMTYANGESLVSVITFIPPGTTEALHLIVEKKISICEDEQLAEIYDAVKKPDIMDIWDVLDSLDDFEYKLLYNQSKAKPELELEKEVMDRMVDGAVSSYWTPVRMVNFILILITIYVCLFY